MSTFQTLRFEQFVAQPPDEVYRAFTRSVHLREWLCDQAQAIARPGGRLYCAWNDGYYAAGEFTTAEPGRKLAFTWLGKAEPGPSQVEVFLTAEDSGIRVAIAHHIPGDGWPVEEFRQGWEAGLENLKSVLETGDDLRVIRRPMLGVFIGEFSPQMAEKLGVPVTDGVRLDDTVEGMGARAAGLRQDDVLVAMAGHPVSDWPSLTSALQAHRAGDRVEVVYYRGGDKQTTIMELSARRLPDVPDTAAAMAAVLETHYVADNEKLAELFAAITAAEADFKPAPNEWSARETLAHLIASEREGHFWMADLVNSDERWSDYFENPTAVYSRLQGIVAATPTVAGLLEELQRAQRETLATIAALPADFVARKSTFKRLGRNLIPSDNTHLAAHAEQIRAAVAAARA